MRFFFLSIFFWFIVFIDYTNRKQLINPFFVLFARSFSTYFYQFLCILKRILLRVYCVIYVRCPLISLYSHQLNFDVSRHFCAYFYLFRNYRPNKKCILIGMRLTLLLIIRFWFMEIAKNFQNHDKSNVILTRWNAINEVIAID